MYIIDFIVKPNEKGWIGRIYDLIFIRLCRLKVMHKFLLQFSEVVWNFCDDSTDLGGL